MSLGQEILDEVYTTIPEAESVRNLCVWITAAGERINIHDMSDRHIINTIALIESKDHTDLYLPYKIEFVKELDKRGVKHNFYL